MKQYTYIRTLALMAIFAFAACGGEDYTDDPIFDQEIKTELVDKSQLPEWLADYINHLEYVPEGQDLPTEPSGIYRFKWNNRFFYEVYSPSQTMMYSDLYLDDGTPVQLVESDYKSLTDNARDWTIVYLLQPSHQPSRNTVYPVETHEYDSFFETTMSYPRYFRFDMYKIGEYVYTINSEEQLKSELSIITCLHWPQIDFSKYTLVIGRVPAYRQKTLRRHEIITDGQESTLRLYFERKLQMGEFMSGDTIEYRPFWALYPKMEGKKLNMEVMINNHNKESNPLKDVILPSQLFPEYWDWEPTRKWIGYISSETFNKYAQNKFWELTDYGEILPDNSVYDYYGSGRLQGGRRYGYAFEGNHVSIYGGDISDLENDQDEIIFSYDENTNKLQIANATFYLLSINEDEMIWVREVYNSMYNGQKGDTYYWLQIFKASEIPQ